MLFLWFEWLWCISSLRDVVILSKWTSTHLAWSFLSCSTLLQPKWKEYQRCLMSESSNFRLDSHENYMKRYCTWLTCVITLLAGVDDVYLGLTVCVVCVSHWTRDIRHFDTFLCREHVQYSRTCARHVICPVASLFKFQLFCRFHHLDNSAPSWSIFVWQWAVNDVSALWSVS